MLAFTVLFCFRVSIVGKIAKISGGVWINNIFLLVSLSSLYFFGWLGIFFCFLQEYLQKV